MLSSRNEREFHQCDVGLQVQYNRSYVGSMTRFLFIVFLTKSIQETTMNSILTSFKLCGGEVHHTFEAYETRLTVVQLVFGNHFERLLCTVEG